MLLRKMIAFIIEKDRRIKETFRPEHCGSKHD